MRIAMHFRERGDHMGYLFFCKLARAALADAFRGVGGTGDVENRFCRARDGDRLPDGNDEADHSAVGI